MNFALTQDQQMIRDAAESFLADASDSAAVRRALQSEAGCDESAWRRIGVELGWCGIGISEAHGGLGLGPVELALVQEQAGRRLLCAPFYVTAGLAAAFLQEAAHERAQARWLPAIATGKAKVSMAVSGTASRWLGASAGVRAREAGGSWSLDGRAGNFLDAGGADWLLVSAMLPGNGVGTFAVSARAPGVALSTARTWDATRRLSDALFDDARAEMRIDDPERGAEPRQRFAALARLYLAAEQLGGAQQCLDLSVAHVAGRRQFGRAIASFQAVKHRCAEMMVKVESLRSMVYGAAATAAARPAADALALECWAAKAMASETYFFCAQEAIQLHGGAGFTAEYDPQLHFKRAQAGSHLLGTADELRGRIAEAILPPRTRAGRADSLEPARR